MRVVLDTNVVISALLFTGARLGEIRKAWLERHIIPLSDKPCTEELIRALSYPKFRLDERDIRILLGDYLPYAEVVDTARPAKRRIPRCRDPHDRKFLQLAYIGDSRALVTGDRDLLELRGQTLFDILRPAEFMRGLRKT